MAILVLVTGGSFDKEYNELDGALPFRTTHVPDLLRLARSTVKLRLHTLFLMDSSCMREEHRRKIYQYCSEAAETRIVITHGTSTMAETASYLMKRRMPKTLVLTGAQIPYSFGSSDGLFNLGSALAYVQLLEQGVYMGMNGNYFPAGVRGKT